MSVTIVSLPPASAGSAKASGDMTGIAAGEDPAIPTLDFADLLISQLLPAESPTLLPSEKTPETLETTATAAETGNLLAALGFVPQEVRPASGLSGDAGSLPVAEAMVEKNPIDTLTRLQTLTRANETVADQPSSSTDALAVSLTASGEKPARFAAELRQAAEIVSPENVTESRTSPNLAPTSSSTLNSQAPARIDTSGTIATPVHDRNWQSDFAQKIVWLATSDKQSAQITLNPPQMGPIEISLNIDKGNATAAFVSANAEVRESIESALPRLREMLASIGIELGQANVSAESFRQQADANAGGSKLPHWQGDKAILVSSVTGQTLPAAFSTQRGNGLVDVFA